MHALDRLTDEVQRGESGLALLILLAAILVAVAVIVAIALTIALAAYYAA